MSDAENSHKLSYSRNRRTMKEPLWMRTLLFFKGIFEFGMRLVGPLFVLLASGLVTLIIVVHFKGNSSF